MIAHGTEALMIRTYSRAPSRPVTGEAKVIVAHNPRNITQSLMQNLKVNTKLDEGTTDQNWRQEVKMADFPVEFKDTYIKMLFD